MGGWLEGKGRVTGKRPIDVQRDAAFALQINAEDQLLGREFLSTADGLYIIKDSSIHKIQLADDIDPDRTNPAIPNLSQQVLTAGYENEIVARVLLTAKYLFDEKNATVKPFVAALFENCILLTRQILELDTMTGGLTDEIGKKEAAFAENPPAPKAFNLPSVSDLDTKVHNILVKADKAKDVILALCSLQLLPSTIGKPKLKDLDQAIEVAMRAEPELIAAWKERSKYFWLIRNMRNVSEHPKENYRVRLADFAMWPDGKVYPPLIEIQHAETPIRTVPLTEFLDFIRNSMLAHAETILAFIRHAVLLKDNPFSERIAEVPEDERRHKYVRYYRAINLNGAWRILS